MIGDALLQHQRLQLAMLQNAKLSRTASTYPAGGSPRRRRGPPATAMLRTRSQLPNAHRASDVTNLPKECQGLHSSFFGIRRTIAVFSFS